MLSRALISARDNVASSRDAKSESARAARLAIAKLGRKRGPPALPLQTGGGSVNRLPCRCQMGEEVWCRCQMGREREPPAALGAKGEEA